MLPFTIMRSLLERLVYEVGPARAIDNASRPLFEEDLTHRSIDALARRLAPTPVPEPLTRWHAA